MPRFRRSQPDITALALAVTQVLAEASEGSPPPPLGVSGGCGQRS